MIHISYRMKEIIKDVLWGLVYATLILSTCYLLFATPDTWRW